MYKYRIYKNENLYEEEDGYESFEEAREDGEDRLCIIKDCVYDLGEDPDEYTLVVKEEM